MSSPSSTTVRRAWAAPASWSWPVVALVAVLAGRRSSPAPQRPPRSATPGPSSGGACSWRGSSTTSRPRRRWACSSWPRSSCRRRPARTAAWPPPGWRVPPPRSGPSPASSGVLLTFAAAGRHPALGAGLPRAAHQLRLGARGHPGRAHQPRPGVRPSSPPAPPWRAPGSAMAWLARPVGARRCCRSPSPVTRPGAANHDTAVNALAVHLVGVDRLARGAARARGDASAARLRPRRRRCSATRRWRCGPSSPSRCPACRAPGCGSVASTAWATSYGLLVVAKALALLALGYAGWRHRRSLLARACSSSAEGARAFVRLVLAELAVMGLAVGVAVALARSAPPVPDTPIAEPSPAEVFTGYPAPGPLTGRPPGSRPGAPTGSGSPRGADGRPLRRGLAAAAPPGRRLAGGTGRSSGCSAGRCSSSRPAVAPASTAACCSRPTWSCTWPWRCSCRCCSCRPHRSPWPCAPCRPGRTRPGVPGRSSSSWCTRATSGRSPTRSWRPRCSSSASRSSTTRRCSSWR